MKKLFIFLFILIIANTATAFAAKARSISTDTDSSFHSNHLDRHIGETLCRATGNYIKVRSQSSKDKIVGHLEQADAFKLLEISNGYALIQVIESHRTSPDSWDGMTGWVDSDYIDCTCTAREYAGSSISRKNNRISSKLEDYIGTTAIVCTGNNLRVRNKPNGKDILGHLEKADEFLLMAIQDGWAYIQVTQASSISPDCWDGLRGWVSTEYLQPKKNEIIPSIKISDKWCGYDSILEYFYHAIIEKWDSQKIVDSGFGEPYAFPNSLKDYGFVLRDINSDNIDELIILSKQYMDSNSDAYLTAIYTKVNKHPIPILESWARSRKYLCSDGGIYEEGSNGASYSVYYIYDLVGSEIIVREGVLSGDYEEHGKTKYGWFLVDERADFSYAKHKLISEKEAKRRIALYQDSIIYHFDNFISFAQYEKERNK